MATILISLEIEREYMIVRPKGRIGVFYEKIINL